MFYKLSTTDIRYFQTIPFPLMSVLMSKQKKRASEPLTKTLFFRWKPLFYGVSRPFLRITGLEPARRRHQNLNLARLPIPPYPPAQCQFIITDSALSVKFILFSNFVPLNEKLNSTYMLNLVLLSSSISVIILNTFYPQ